MKPLPVLLSAVLSVTLSLSGAVAQTITAPPAPGQFTGRKLGENGGATAGGSSVGVSSGGAAASRTVVIQYVAVSPVRAWTNAEGKAMQARLLAFSAPAEGEKGPVEVIREGKVRFLLVGGKAPIDYPIAQLSQADQIDIKAIAQAASRGRPGEESGSGESGEAPETRP